MRTSVYLLTAGSPRLARLRSVRPVASRLLQVSEIHVVAATHLLPSDYTAIGCLRSRRVSCCLGLVGGLDGLIPEKGDYRVPPMSPLWANTAKKAARGASQLVRASPSENCCPFKLPLLLQHPRAVDTQDATVQVITPCYAWGEAWVA